MSDREAIVALRLSPRCSLRRPPRRSPRRSFLAVGAVLTACRLALGETLPAGESLSARLPSGATSPAAEWPSVSLALGETHPAADSLTFRFTLGKTSPASGSPFVRLALGETSPAAESLPARPAVGRTPSAAELRPVRPAVGGNPSAAESLSVRLASSETRPAAESPSAESLSLDEAVAMALQNSRIIDVAELDVQRADQSVSAAKTRRLPDLDLEVLGGKTLTSIETKYAAGSFGTFPVIGPVPAEDVVVKAPTAVSGTVQATVSQPLTQLHRIGLGVKLKEVSREIEREKLRGRRASIASQVRRLYYQLLQAQSARTASEEQVRVVRELDRVVDSQVEVGAALRSDSLQVKARLASAQYDLEKLDGDLSIGKQRMNQLLGRDVTRDFELVDLPVATPEEMDLDAALARAVEHRPDLAEARLSVTQADTDRRMKKAESIPDLSLAVSYSTFLNVDLVPGNIAIAGVQLKWEPFDWGRRRKERAEKALQLEQARISAQEAESEARIEVAQQFRAVREARLLLEAERLGRDAADEKLRVTTARHRQEASLLKDVLEAQASRSAAGARYDQAFLTFLTARASLQEALGEE